jgi:hypothetical protein
MPEHDPQARERLLKLMMKRALLLTVLLALILWSGAFTCINYCLPGPPKNWGC